MMWPLPGAVSISAPSAFLMVYNFAKRLKTLKWLPPYEYICKIGIEFGINSFQYNVGLNI